jgi:transaldolase
MPEKTIAAFIDHGTVTDTVEHGLEAARQVIAGLGHLGIDFGCCAVQLENEGIQKFIEPYDALMQYIAKAAERGR